jgi:hypothetical protein
VEHAEELIYDLQSANCRRREPSNKRSRLFLQAVSFRKPDGRQRDDEQSHQPVFSECPAKHVYDAFLAWLGEEGKRLKDAVAGKKRQSGGNAGNQPGSHNHEGGAKAKRQPDDHNRNSTELQEIYEMHIPSSILPRSRIRAANI